MFPVLGHKVKNLEQVADSGMAICAHLAIWLNGESYVFLVKGGTDDAFVQTRG